LRFGTVFTNIILLWIPNPLQKNPLKLEIYDFVNLELEVWDLVQCLLIKKNL